MNHLPAILGQSQQDAVIKAINDSVRTETPAWVVWALMTVAALGITLLVIAQRHRNRKPIEPVRKAVNNPKRLVREMAEALQLSPGELRKLEHHAAKAGVENSITLLLCPSLAKKDER